MARSTADRTLSLLIQSGYPLIQPRSAATVIGSVQGNTSLGLVDVTQAPYVSYTWNGSQYVAVTPGGGSPTGNAGGALAGTYPNPSLSSNPIALPGGSTAVTQTSGDNSTKVATTAYVAANAGGAPSGSASGALAGTYPGPSLAVGALPNGMTATTQANGDNSTKVATTAYVVANGGGAPSGSAGGSLTGSYPNPGLAAASVVAGVAGQSLSPAAVGTIKEVDGFSGGGIGVAQTVWSSGTYPLCSAVSHSGADYLSAGVTTGVTPGTNSQVWYPVTNASTPTALDCAFYVSAASLVSGTGTVANGGVGATVQMGTAGTYCTNIGLTEPTVSSPGQPVVNIYGPGRSQATVKQCTAKTDGLATLYQPPTLTPYAFASFNWQGFSVDANYIAPAAVNVYGAQQFTMKDMILADATDGSDHEVEFGNAADTAHGWTFEPYLDNVDLGTFRGFGTGAIISTTVSGGVPSFTVTAGGSNYDSATTQVILAGTSDFGRPCSSPGTTTATISGGAITGITSSATGCVSPVYTIVYGGADVSYGYKFSNVTDAKQISNLTNGRGLDRRDVHRRYRHGAQDLQLSPRIRAPRRGHLRFCRLLFLAVRHDFPILFQYPRRRHGQPPFPILRVEQPQYDRLARLLIPEPGRGYPWIQPTASSQYRERNLRQLSPSARLRTLRFNRWRHGFPCRQRRRSASIVCACGGPPILQPAW